MLDEDRALRSSEERARVKREPHDILSRALAAALLLHVALALVATLVLTPQRRARVPSPVECDAAAANVGDVVAIVLETEGEPAGSRAIPPAQDDDTEGAHEATTTTSASTGALTSASTSTGSSRGEGASGATSTSTPESMGASAGASTPPATEAAIEARVAPTAPVADVWGTAPPLAGVVATSVTGAPGALPSLLARGALPDAPPRGARKDLVLRRAGPRGLSPAEARQKLQAALRAPARRRERELGLGPEGPVLHALGDAISASQAPVRGRAVFLAVADAGGMIVGIDVVECNGERPGWASAAALARLALGSTKLRMPSTAQHAEMRIEVVSDWKLPSLHDPGVDSSVFSIGVGAGEGAQSTKVAVLDVLPSVHMAEIARGLTLPVPKVAGDAIAADGDLADLGARPRRVVRARLLDSLVL
jgi:hypothetical protein